MPPSVIPSVDGDGVGWIVFDDPAARANVLNPATQADLAGALAVLAGRRVKAVVVTSAKDRIFIAGADLAWLAGLPSVAAAGEISRAGQRLFQSIADCPAPVICAIHGACAGGGFELALACHWRIASDAPATRIGLPEASLGTLPGWGGCVRLPRLIGESAAIDHILQARLLPAAEALEAGLVDEVVPAAELKAAAKAAALRVAASSEGAAMGAARSMGFQLAAAKHREDGPMFSGHKGPPFVEESAKLSRKAPTLSDAPTRRVHAKVTAVVEQGAGLSLEAALELEAGAFGELTASATCKNLIRVFFLGEGAKKRTLDGWYDVAERASVSKPAPEPERNACAFRYERCIGIVGAGVMGAGIAQCLAAHGFAVVLRDTQPECLERGLGAVHGLFDAEARRGRLSAEAAAAGVARVTGTAGWDGFEQCDLVIEAIVENVAAKRQLFSELATVVRPGTLLASNTSALPIEEISGHVPHPERILGLHFFNPVSRMPLVELVLARSTAPAAAEQALGLVKALGKSAVVCRSSPGFLVTRILFFYLNEAVRLLESGFPAEEIDGAMREYGWPMGPLRLIDEIGVDVTDFIFGEMAHYFPLRFTATSACGRRLAEGFKGRKNGAGFYTYPEEKIKVGDLSRATNLAALCGGATSVSPSVARASARVLPNEHGLKPMPLSDPVDMEVAAPALAGHLMRIMSDEARLCLAEGVVRSADDVDFAVISGLGFPAWRGGLIKGSASV